MDHAIVHTIAKRMRVCVCDNVSSLKQTYETLKPNIQFDHDLLVSISMS